MPIEVGSRAPDIALISKTKNGLEHVSLTRNVGKGRTVLLFVPLAFSDVCSEEFCTINDSLQLYHSLGADVIGISVDNPFALEAWAKVEELKFTLASDFNRVASESYGVLNKCFLPDVLAYKGVANRAVFIIGKDGLIEYSWISFVPQKKPRFEDISGMLSVKKD